MKIEKFDIEDLILFKPKVFTDSRGYFVETFNNEKYNTHIGDVQFIQDNESESIKGVLRGLHFQTPPFAQSKLVRCIKGIVLDVAVDLRKDSPTFGQYQSVLLTGENMHQFFVPKGFAHGFVVLSEKATFSYKVDNLYSPSNDSGIVYNDTNLNIDWKFKDIELILSIKDKGLPLLAQIESPF